MVQVSPEGGRWRGEPSDYEEGGRVVAWRSRWPPEELGGEAIEAKAEVEDSVGGGASRASWAKDGGSIAGWWGRRGRERGV